MIHLESFLVWTAQLEIFTQWEPKLEEKWVIHDRDDDREPTNANEAIDKGLPPTNEEDVKMGQ